MMETAAATSAAATSAAATSAAATSAAATSTAATATTDEAIVTLATGSLPNYNVNLVVCYLNQIRKGLTSMEGYASTSYLEAPIPNEVVKSLMEIVGNPELFNAAYCCYRRVLNQLSFQFFNTNKTGLSDTINSGNDVENKSDRIIPSDLEDQIQYKPTEAFGDKVAQIIAYICAGELLPASEELTNLQRMRDNLLHLYSDLDEGFYFVAKTFECFLNMTTGNHLNIVSHEEGKNVIPIFDDLTAKGKLTVRVVQSHIFRNFRCKSNQRVDTLKQVVIEDDSVTEWWITLAEAVRRKRRDVPKHYRGKRPLDEEYQYVDKALKLDSENPFVKLTLMDCIIDCLRDSKGSFVCGGITFTNSGETVAFMKDSCRKLLKQFPRSVKFHSQISDYFARFVTLCYFDIPFAEECLGVAYNLNPNYPPTTHRLGIFNRMSKGALTTSFEWFKITEKMDSYHFNSFMECVKNMIGRPEDYNAAEVIEEKLCTPGACSWPEVDILELIFYKGIAHFSRKEYEEALEAWELVSIHNEEIFRLCDLDQTCGFYNWDETLISRDKLQIWMKNEKSKVDQCPTRTEFVTLLYNLMIGTVEPKKSNLYYNSLSCPGIFQRFKPKNIDTTNG